MNESNRNNEGLNEMKNASELSEIAKQQIESKSGYSYDTSIVDAICKAGYDGLSDGAVLADNGKQIASICKSRDVMVIRDADGIEIKSVPLTDEMKDKAVIVTAIKKSRS